MKVNGQMKQELRDELRRRPWGRLLLWVGILFKEVQGGFGAVREPLGPDSGQGCAPVGASLCSEK